MKRILPEIYEAGGKQEESPSKKQKRENQVQIYFLFKGEKHAVEIDREASTQEVLEELLNFYNKVLVPPEMKV